MSLPGTATSCTISATVHHTTAPLTCIVTEGAALMACLDTILALGIIVFDLILFGFKNSGFILDWFSRVERGFKCLDLSSLLL